MPGVNGHEEGVALVHAGRPISSFEPAMRFKGSVGFCARLGSFCLFMGKGPGNTRLTWTLVKVGTALNPKLGMKVTVTATTLTISHRAMGSRRVLFLISASLSNYRTVVTF